MYEQFVEQKERWIGGRMVEFTDPALGDPSTVWGGTVITDVLLRPNGNSYWFEFSGESFSNGFDVKCGGISGSDGEDGLHFRTMFGGHFAVWNDEEIA